MLLYLSHAYNEGDSLESFLDGETPITGLGFYDSTGQQLYKFGTSPPEYTEFENDLKIEHDKNAIVMTKDFLLPFDTDNTTIPLFDNLNKKYEKNKDRYKDEDDHVRYGYLKIKNEFLLSYLFKYRLMKFASAFFMIIITVLLLSTYRKKINFEQIINAQKNLVALGSAARALNHELKNPLSVIMLQASLIEAADCGLHRKQLTTINCEVRHIASQIDKLSDFLRRPEGSPAEINLNRALPRLSMIEAADFSIDTCGTELMIRMDHERFRSVIENILTNALESGSKAEDISIRLRPQGRKAVIIVQDRGRGIPDEEYQKLFNPFFTTKSKGSGGGLSIVKSFMEAVDGKICIRSEMGIGTEVCLQFPISNSKSDFKPRRK